ncbi:MAG: penicillin-binding protein 1A [Porticoccaceae bacterium]|nr:penicillin-binding protein 1A [Porticoccaceae bacterium]
MRKLIKPLALLALLGIGGFLVVASCLYLYLSPKLPSVEELKEIELQIPLRIYSQDLKVIAEFGEKKRSPVSFDEIPQPMIDAFLAAEDDGFFEHGGIAVTGLLRAASELITTGQIRSGGSTITMQVARNFFLSNRQEFTRKFNEILLAFKIEEGLSKQEILSLYTNKIYFGNRAYGIGAAANVYYGKKLDQLTLAQSAMIAGLPKAPSSYNPIANPERALIRRNWILKRMLSLDNITEEQYQIALAETDQASYHGSISELSAAYIAEMVRQQVVDKFGLKAYTEGYSAITTIDSTMQKQGVDALQEGILAYDQRHGYRGPEVSAVAEQEWLELLSKTATFGALEPVIVSDVADDRLWVLNRSGDIEELNWLDGLKNLRLYKTVNARSAPITSAIDLFSRGDLIRIIRRVDGSPTLAQMPEVQAALVALNPQDGAIRTLVGGFDFRHSRFNRVTQALRQPGSNFKPFIYAAALNSGFTPASIINDAPVVFNDKNLEDMWRPENDGGKFYGPTRLREALYRSRNMVSIRLLRRMGIDRTLEGLQAFGFNTGDMPIDLSLALGSHALTPLKVASAYNILANGGYSVSPYVLDTVIDRDGNIIFQATPKTRCDSCETDTDDSQTSFKAMTADQSETNAETYSAAVNQVDLQLEELLNSLANESIAEEERKSLEVIKRVLQQRPTDETAKPRADRVINKQTAFLIDSMLKDVISRGTGVKAKVLNRTDLAGKTGTTNGPRDAWFSGYSPHLTVTTWVGFDDNSKIGRNEYGGSAALPIWIDFAREALDGKPNIERPQPDGIVMVKVDAKTGNRVAPNQSGIFEFFRTENVPELIGGETLPGGADNSLPDDLF